jgi:purine-nucleoside phosphorylase
MVVRRPSGVDEAEAACRVLQARMEALPEAVVVLGSGLGHLGDTLEDPIEIPFQDLPGFPPTGVRGHQGRYLAGRLGARYVLAQSGRYHVYEGHRLDVVTMPVRVAAGLGVRFLLLTNAAGGADPTLEPGDVVLLEDHLNLMWRAPLSGRGARTVERRYFGLQPYDEELNATALQAAAELKIPLRRGVYAAVTGPSYETPAEVGTLRRMGADVIGMSTVPEAIAGAALGLRCLALSVVTNKAAGLAPRPLSHAEVVEVGSRAGDAAARILEGVVRRLPGAPQSRAAK